MEKNQNQPPNQLQKQINTLLQTPAQVPQTASQGTQNKNLETTRSPEPKLIMEKPKGNYFERLFSGRMNRQNYIIGSTVFVLLPLGCFLVVIFNILLSPNTLAMPYINPNNPGQIVTPQVSIPSLLTSPGNEVWTALGILFFILSIPYLFSMQIKRLHDLNLNGWLWIINFLPLFFLKQTFSLTEIAHPDMLFWISNFVSLVSSIFSLYVSIWPGTKVPNKYGEQPPPGSKFLRDVLEIR